MVFFGVEHGGLGQLPAFFGPPQVDYMIRQAMQFCWLTLPVADRGVDRVERQVREVLEAALRDFRRDSEGFAKGMGLPGIVPYTVPAGSVRGVDQDIPTFAFTTGIAVDPELDEELVYQMTKNLVENWSDMGLVMESLKKISPEQLAVPLGADFHPGAARYYQERGWIQ